MFFLSTAKILSVINNKYYKKQITKKYDEMKVVINDNSQPKLSMEVFLEFGIKSLKDLLWYLEKYAEYGGYISVPWTDELVLLPFHHDFMNSWLRFDNPRVEEVYNSIYEERKSQFDSRVHFNMKRFDIEEDLQLNNWTMPPLDRRMLAAPINGCWDRPELVACLLELHGYETKRLCCHDGNIMRGHCFSIYSDGEYWNTISSFPLNLHCKNYMTLCRIVYFILKQLPIYSDRKQCELVEFKAPHPGMNTREYLKNIEMGKVIIHNR